jgi:hypothetical protein
VMQLQKRQLELPFKPCWLSWLTCDLAIVARDGKPLNIMSKSMVQMTLIHLGLTKIIILDPLNIITLTTSKNRPK